MKFSLARTVFTFVLLVVFGRGMLAVVDCPAYAQEKTAAQQTSEAVKPATTAAVATKDAVDALSKRFDQLEQQLKTLTQQTAPTTASQQAALVASYRSYFDAARKSPGYAACKSAGGRAIIRVTDGQGTVTCEVR